MYPKSEATVDIVNDNLPRVCDAELGVLQVKSLSHRYQLGEQRLCGDMRLPLKTAAAEVVFRKFVVKNFYRYQALSYFYPIQVPSLRPALRLAGNSAFEHYGTVL